MNAIAKKLAHVYGISRAQAQVLIVAGLNSPRKVKAAGKSAVNKIKLPKSAKDKIKARQ